MPSLRCRPTLFALCLSVPAAVFAATPAIPAQAGVAAVILWLAALGWGFHAMLHHRLAAEDRLAQLEADVARERDARAAQRIAIRQQMLLLETEWLRLETCLCDGDIRHVPDSMRAMHDAITLLQQDT